MPERDGAGEACVKCKKCRYFYRVMVTMEGYNPYLCGHIQEDTGERPKPLTPKEANAFAEQNHQHHRSAVGHKFSVGLSDGEKIVGVVFRMEPCYNAPTKQTEVLPWQSARRKRYPTPAAPKNAILST